MGKPPGSRLDQLGLQLGRAWYAYLALLNRMLREADLEDHLQPGFGSLLFALFENDEETLGTLAVAGTHIANPLDFNGCPAWLFHLEICERYRLCVAFCV